MAGKGAEASLSNLSAALVFIRLPELREELKYEETHLRIGGGPWADTGSGYTYSSQKLWCAYCEITDSLLNRARSLHSLPLSLSQAK